MARLFWVGTGAVLTVVVLVKGRQVVRRYAPAALVERANLTAQRTGDALGEAATHFLADFRAARDERAATLQASLLAPTQGSVEDLRHRSRGSHPRHAVEVDHDEDELGYSF